jgi:hypothetical protein
MFADNVSLTLDGVLYLKIVDPFKASYGVEVIISQSIYKEGFYVHIIRWLISNNAVQII